MISLTSFSLQGEEIKSLIDQLQDHRLVHALLITGESGLGKRTFASLIAAGILCKSDGKHPCGHCSDCLAAFSFEHPDLTLIQKGVPISADVSKGRATIPVDDIREMIRITSTHALESSSRVVLIFDADRMTPQAQNCLLKTLEEPPESTYMILVTNHAENILPTVVSRCRTVRLQPWRNDYILKILAEKGTEESKARMIAANAMGSIGKALEYASDDAYWIMRKEILHDFFDNVRRSDISSASNRWKERKGDSEQLLDILETLVSSLSRYRLLRNNEDLIREFPANWQNWAKQSDLSRFTLLADAVRNARKEIDSNVNYQAVIEQLLLVFMGEGTR